METLYPSSSDLHVPVHEQPHELSWKEKLTARTTGAAAKVNAQLRAKPALFAGIAAGAGLALGIAGRIARHRVAKKRPTLLIIEGAC